MLGKHLPAGVMNVKNDRVVEAEVHIFHLRLSRGGRLSFPGNVEMSLTDGRRRFQARLKVAFAGYGSAATAGGHAGKEKRSQDQDKGKAIVSSSHAGARIQKSCR